MHATGLKTLAAFVGLSFSAILLGAQRRTASITTSQTDDHSADSHARQGVATDPVRPPTSANIERRQGRERSNESDEHQENSPAVVLFSTRPASTTTQVIVANEHTAPQQLAEIAHVPEAIVRGAVLPSRNGAPISVVAIADRVPGHRSWPSSLFAIESTKVVELTNQIATGSRPIVDNAGHVYVVRGREGTEPRGAEMRERLRIDTVEIVEIDLATRASRTLLRTEAYGALIAAWDASRGELIADIATPHGATLVGLDTTTLAQRIIVAHWPLGARDISLDPVTDSIVVQQRDGSSITVERVDLASGKRSVLERGRTRDLAPFALPEGRWLLTHGDDAKPDRDTEIVGGPALDLPTRQGTLWVRAMSADQRWLSALGLRHRAPPVALVVNVTSGQGRVLRAPENTWIEIAGFVDAPATSREEVAQ